MFVTSRSNVGTSGFTFKVMFVGLTAVMKNGSRPLMAAKLLLLLA